MKWNENEVEKYQDLVYHYAIYKTGDTDIAKDIAAETIHLAFLKKDEIENIKHWLIATCNIYCKKYFGRKKKDENLSQKLRNSVVSYLGDDSIERDYELHKAYQEALAEISDKEIQTIIFYFHCEQNVKKMSEITGESYATLRKRIYRIKSTLKAETYKKMGVISSKKIMTPKLNDQITKFLANFKTNLEQNTIHKMKRYFSEIDLQNIHLDFDIEKILDFELGIEDNIYTVYVFFETSAKEPDCLFIKFYVNDKNQLKIVVPPSRGKKLVTMDLNSEAAKKLLELLKKYPTNRFGRTDVPSEEVEKILANVTQEKDSTA
jgi:DNA-directed RNA polymerase specialized sigma24 family protein